MATHAGNNSAFSSDFFDCVLDFGEEAMKIYTQYLALFIGLVGILFASGSRVNVSKLADPRPRVLALFTDVPEGFVKVLDNADGDTLFVLQDGKEADSL